MSWCMLSKKKNKKDEMKKLKKQSQYYVSGFAQKWMIKGKEDCYFGIGQESKYAYNWIFLFFSYT